MDKLDELILEDLRNHVPWATIAKNRGTNPNHISELKKKYLSEQTSINEDEIGTKAFKLFEEGKDPIQVTIELGKAPQLVNELHKMWVEMKHSSNREKEECSKELEEKFKSGYTCGYNDAMRGKHFLLNCQVCGEPVNVIIDDEDWENYVKPWAYSMYNNKVRCSECRKLSL